MPLARGAIHLRVSCGQRRRDAEPRDVSPFGLSVDDDSFSGLRIGETVAGELEFQSRRIAVRLLPTRRSGGRIGLRVATSQRDELMRAYLKQRFPRLVPRSETDPQSLAALLGESGYGDLRAAECSLVEWQHFTARDSFDYVYQARDGRVLGHVSGTRVYDKTWLAHQLATLGGHPESGQCRATLYEFNSALPRSMEGDGGYVLAYFNLQKRWHDVFFRDFVLWVNDAAASVLYEWDTFEVAELSVQTLSGSGPEFEIGAIQPNEREAATALVRSSLPSLMADALDLRPERLSRAALNGDTRRARHALGVRSLNQLLAVALCEIGPKSASLFNLLNTAQLFVADAPFAAQRALLHAVRAFYAERGVERPLLFCPPDTLDAAREPSIRFRERMGAIAHGGKGLLQWENYCRVQMGRLFRRKDRINDRETASEQATR